MTEQQIDIVALQKAVAPAVDAVLAYRMACGKAQDLEQATAVREAIEDSVVQAFEAIDACLMPAGWSCDKAAEAIALQVGQQMTPIRAHGTSPGA